MKKSIPALLTFSVASLLVLTTSPRMFKEVKAYDVSPLPTVIDLNDDSAETIKEYYSFLNSLDESERKGSNLLKNLKPILKKGQKYFSYDTSNLWGMYEITDRDWEKSPATDLNNPNSPTYGEGKYDPDTNTITDYKYGKSVSNHQFDPYIHALYVNRNVDNQTTAWSDHGQTQWGINQEHIWPKSQGFNADGAGGARGDPMHLWAGNGRVNGTEHNNHPYGFVDKAKDYIDPVSKKNYENLADNLMGKTLNGDNKGANVFEPQDSDKGDIARSIFYMVARYNFLSGEDNDGIDTNNPNLEIVQDTPEKSSYTSSKTITGQMGLLTDLLEWHHLDPVDEYEIHRNNLLFNNYTHNRNPFIDYPEWVDYVWGKVEYSGNKLLAYDSTPTGAANPETDEVQLIVKELSISKSNLQLKPGETAKINAVSMDGSNISWSLSNGAATLSKEVSASGEDVTITAVNNGEVIITAKATVNGTPVERKCVLRIGDEQIIDDEPKPNNSFVDSKMFYILIAGGIGAVLFLVIFVIIYSNANKKQKKKMIKGAKKVVNKATKKKK